MVRLLRRRQRKLVLSTGIAMRPAEWWRSRLHQSAEGHTSQTRGMVLVTASDLSVVQLQRSSVLTDSNQQTADLQSPAMLGSCCF